MAKKKTKRKTGKKQNFTPGLECPHVGEMILSHTTDSTGALATKATDFLEAKAAWKGDVRKHFADGGTKKDVPTLVASKFPNPNTGRQTRKQQEALVETYNEALDAGSKLPVFPPTYNPVEIDLLHAMNASVLRRGVVSKHSKSPANWDEKRYGSWHLADEDGNFTIPSGWFFDKKVPRRCHTDNVLTRIDNPDENIITIGKTRYVVGTGGHDGSAVFLVRAHKGGNYGACDEARKRMSLANSKGLANLVFRIEDKANHGGAFRIRAGRKDVEELCFMPGQVLTAGYLSNGKQMTPDQIRKLAADAKGIKFEKLPEPIEGEQIEWKGEDGLWKEIQTIQGKKETTKQKEREGRGEAEDVTPQGKAIRNANVECRCDPCESYPFGLRSVQLDMVPYVVASGEGNIDGGHFSMGIVIGARSNFNYSVGVNEAKRDAVEEVEEEVEEEVPEPKKAAKPKAEKEKKTKKATSKKAVKKQTDAAPPVEAEVTESTTAETATTE